jgi:hypothetical protein
MQEDVSVQTGRSLVTTDLGIWLANWPRSKVAVFGVRIAMPLSATIRCPRCDVVWGSFVLYEPGESPSGETFMFGEALKDATVGRLSYELPSGTGVRILAEDEVDDIRAALTRGDSAALFAALPDVLPYSCSNGHVQGERH